ncbi:MAG: hypothetical protein IJS32_00615 [Kiritimatiellae bacterium]|nr:hypothetical protein [Kiritimatiellia bacterium]
MKKNSDTGYFVISPQHEHVVVEKAHFCTWNLKHGPEFLEIGMLIRLKEGFKADHAGGQSFPRLEFKVHIPWYDGQLLSGDLFPSLKNPENARFVFNEQVAGTEFISGGGSTPRGVLFSFGDKQRFCLLPLTLRRDCDTPNTISAEVSFPQASNDFERVGERIYFRFFVKSNGRSIPWEHGGIAKTVFCYDIKVNEPRNAPDKFPLEQMVDIRSCYCLHIVPSAFECALQDRAAFKSIRTLESSGAVTYTKDLPGISATIEPGDCLVVFNKLKHEDNQNLPFSFFTLFSKERIGPSQLALAIGANIVCSLFSGWWRLAAFVLFSAVMFVAWFRSGHGHR